MEIVIAGAGIGGLTTALSLHAAGYTDVRVLEGASEIREIGVGLNLPPHAVRELTELGLNRQLEHIGVSTAELAYYDAEGRLIWAEPRGLEAGYRWPQYSIHRGKLQRMLIDAVHERLGRTAVETGVRVASAELRAEGGVEISAFAHGGVQSYRADVLIAADGIRSALRDHFYEKTLPLSSNGWVMYRGAAVAPPFLTGRSMVIVGDEHQRMVVYPIGDGVLNWLFVRPNAKDYGADELGNWNARVEPARVAGLVEHWRFDWLDIHALVQATADVYEYPMADIEPLPRWVFGHCALVGDAAHAMYPFGSNGASQAILDARVLAHELAVCDDIEAALHSYESQRRELTAQVQLANRRQADNVMATISEMARRNAHDDAAKALQEVEAAYKKAAGFDVEALNTRPSWSIRGTRA